MAEKAIAKSAPKSRKLLIGVTLSGLLAGVMLGFLVDRNANFFQRSEELRDLVPPYPLVYAEQIQTEDQVRLGKNTSLAVGLIGAVLGLVLGGFAGFARGTTSSLVQGLVLGLLLGGACGAAGGFANVKVWEMLSAGNSLDPPQQASVAHGVGWICLSVGLALAMGLVLVPRGKMIFKLLLSALGASIIVAVLFPFLSAAIDPSGQDAAFPVGLGNRLLWVTLYAGVLSLAVARVLARYEPEAVTLQT